MFPEHAHHPFGFASWGHALAMGPQGKGNGGEDPALAADAPKGARSNGNSKEGPTPAMDACRNNNGNGNGRRHPALGNVTSYMTVSQATN